MSSPSAFIERLMERSSRKSGSPSAISKAGRSRDGRTGLKTKRLGMFSVFGTARWLGSTFRTLPSPAVRTGSTELDDPTPGSAIPARQPHGLQRGGQVVEAVQDDGQPGRMAEIAQVSEPQTEAEHFEEEVPVILQVQRGSDQRRQHDRAGHPQARIRPAAKQKAAREQ